MTASNSIFISRTGQDSDFATWIAETLEHVGYDCVLQDKDFHIGESFPGNMREAFENCDTMIAVMSPDYWQSSFCLDEWDTAYALDRGRQGKLIPVMTRPCDVPRLAARLAYLDLTRADNETERASTLVQTVDHVLKQGGGLPHVFELQNYPICNDSFLTDHFAGREEELNFVHAALWGGVETAAITPPAAVTGLGGVGKSAIAREYAFRHLARYSGAWLVRAETTTTRDEDLAQLGAKLDARLRDAQDISAAAKEAAHLARQKARNSQRPFLIVLDNVETSSGVPDWLRGEGLHILASSRYRTWPAWARKVDVRKLPLEAARNLLLETSGRQAEEGLNDLLEALDGLPLALIQAGSYLRENPGERFKEYAEALARRLGESPDAWDEDQKLVAATYLPSIDKAEASAPGARELIIRAAFFDPEAIPLAILSEDWCNADIRRASDALDRYSLWRRDAEAGLHGARFNMHRVLQMVVRASLDTEAEETAVKACASLLWNRFEGDPADVRTWEVNGPLAPHAMTLADLTKEAFAHPDLAGALGETDRYFFARARFNLAETASGRALAIVEAVNEPDNPDVALRLNNLAQLLQETNRPEEAETMMRRALEIDKAAYGPDHPDVARDLTNLAQLLYVTNRLAEAEPMMCRALAIVEAAYGPDHPDVAIRLNNLAILLQDTIRLEEAEPMLRRALAIVEAAYGPDHPDVAIRLSNLARLLNDTNRMAEAEPMMRRALDIYEVAYGPDHPTVAIVLNNLAQLLRGTNRLAEAEPMMRRTLEIDKAAYGPDHPDVARDLSNLASLLQDTNRLAEAEPMMRRSLDIYEAAYGPDHPTVAIVLNNLAELLRDTNRLEKAEPLMRRALDIFHGALSDEHPSTQIVRQNYNHLLAEIGGRS